MTAHEQSAGGSGIDVLHSLPNFEVVINDSWFSAPSLANSKYVFTLSSHAITHSVMTTVWIVYPPGQSICASPIGGSCHLASIKAQQQLTP